MILVHLRPLLRWFLYDARFTVSRRHTCGRASL